MDENEEKNKKYSLKIIMVGDTSVGKANITYRFSQGEFTNDIEPTIVTNYLTKNIIIDGILFRLQIWDTAGSEKFRSITRAYYKSAACAIIVYDITRKDTFENVSKWVEECKLYNEDSTYIILVGNKDDLQNREVTKKEGEKLAEDFNLKFFESSALNGHNIEDIFLDACIEINQKMKNGEINLNNISCGVNKIDDKEEFIAEKSYDSKLMKHKTFKLKKENAKNRAIRKKKCHC